MRLAVLIAVSLVASARAEPKIDMRIFDATAQIEKLEVDLEYEHGLVLADRTIALGLAAPKELAKLEMLAGRLAAGLDHADTAQAHFARALAIDPDVTLEPGTSPKLQGPFDAARAQQPTLGVKFDRGATEVTAIIEHDPLGLVVGIGVLVHGEDKWRVARGHAYTIASDVELDGLEVTDEHGNMLVVAPGRRAGPAPARVPIVWDHRPVRLAPPLYRRWRTYAVATGVLLAGAGVCAWRYGVAQDAWNQENDGLHDYSRLHALEDRGQRWAIAADVGFGLAAVAGIAAAMMFSTRTSEPTVGVAFTGTGATFVTRF